MSAVGFIYFLQPTEGGPVKIGWSRSPTSRLQIYSAWSPVPLRLRGAVPAPSVGEIVLHERLSEHRAHHEWFQPAPDVLKYVEAAESNGSLGQTFEETLTFQAVLNPQKYECRVLDLLSLNGLEVQGLADWLDLPPSRIRTWGGAYVPVRYVEKVAAFFAGQGVVVRPDDWLGAEKFTRPLPFERVA
ncbi:MAG: GIY-YIG nuclease family protein [Pseudomonadota bacterium]|nr:GIY-YIG nuclease family protein [Pseudomonadota bacterium]